MNRGFYTIMAAQFLSSLADNALLVVAIALLIDLHAPDFLTPILKFVFVLFYVILAPFVGAFADSMPKGRVMFISNTIKVLGCVLLFFAMHQYSALGAYAIVGLGAAAYSPAKYGILTELLPPEKLVVANGWIEGLTVASIVLGTMLGGTLIAPSVSQIFLTFGFPFIHTATDMSIFVVGVIYLLAAIFNLYIPNTGIDHRIPKKSPLYLVHEFAHCVRLLWTDKLGQITLAVTTLLWGAGATLQFVVINWAEVALGYSLSKAAQLQGIVALGIAIGAVMAARSVSLKRSLSVIPLGIAIGLVVITLVFVHDFWVSVFFLVIIGAMSGFFVVPMNALLQHRGYILMGAGHSIAVQNFNENLSILVMLSLYALLIYFDVHIYIVIVMFGLFLSTIMALVYRWHTYNQGKEDSLHLIGTRKIHRR